MERPQRSQLGASDQLANTLIKLRTDITSIQEFHADKHEFGCVFVVNKRLRHLWVYSCGRMNSHNSHRGKIL